MLCVNFEHTTRFAKIYAKGFLFFFNYVLENFLLHFITNNEFLVLYCTLV
jgi:hypothetical protein